MKILILYSHNCHFKDRLVDIVKQAADELYVTFEIEEKIVETPEEAHRFRFYGSPTIKVEGRDLEPEAEVSKTPGLG